MTQRRTGLTLVGVLLGACSIGGDAGPPAAGVLRAVVVRPVGDTLSDTVRFEGAAEAAHCDSARGLVLHGVSGVNGLLLWLRPGDSALAGAYTYATRRDTVTDRSAVAALRFAASDLTRGVTLDSGRLEVTQHAETLSAVVRGSGLAFPGGLRVALEAEFLAVPVSLDTANCESEP